MFLIRPIGQWLEENRNRFSCPPDCKRIKDCYGLEIEVEGHHSFKSSSVLNQNFRVTHDGSLRGDAAKEYCLKGPRSIKGFIEAIHEFYNNLDDHFRPSYRAATHIHMNMYMNTMMDLANTAFKYYTLEEALSLEHRERFDNPFSLKLSNAKFPVIVLIQSFAQESLNPLATDDIRYGSLNFKALMDHSSLEFRAFETSLDKEKLINRIKILHDIKKTTVSSPKELFNKFNSLGTDEFISDVYGPFIYGYVSRIPGYKQAVIDSFRAIKIWINTHEWKTE